MVVEEMVEEVEEAEEESKCQFLPNDTILEVFLYLLDPCHVHAHHPTASPDEDRSLNHFLSVF